ncbi:hypothetical protein BH10CYA1_BH10CYA1_03450 [soil metagenome]
MVSDNLAKPITFPQSSNESLFDDFWKSTVHAGIEAPITAVGQMFDAQFDFSPIKPAETKEGSAHYYVQGIGGAVGLIADFALLKCGLNSVGKTSIAADLHVSTTLTNPFGQSIAGGALYGGILTPIDANYGNQFTSRMKNAALTAGTFGALHGLSAKFSTFAKSENAFGATAQTIGMNAAIGVPIGMLTTQAQSLLFEHKFASLQQTTRAGIDWAVVGGALAAPGAIKERLQSKNSDDARNDVATAKNELLPNSNDTLASHRGQDDGVVDKNNLVNLDQISEFLPNHHVDTIARVLSGKNEDGTHSSDGVTLQEAEMLLALAHTSPSLNGEYRPQYPPGFKDAPVDHVKETLNLVISKIRERGPVAGQVLDAIDSHLPPKLAAAVSEFLSGDYRNIRRSDSVGDRDHELLLETYFNAPEFVIQSIVSKLRARGPISNDVMDSIEKGFPGGCAQTLSNLLAEGRLDAKQEKDFVNHDESVVLSQLEQQELFNMASEVESTLRARGPVAGEILDIAKDLNPVRLTSLDRIYSGHDYFGQPLEDHLSGFELEILDQMKNSQKLALAKTVEDKLKERGPISKMAVELQSEGLEDHAATVMSIRLHEAGATKFVEDDGSPASIKAKRSFLDVWLKLQRVHTIRPWLTMPPSERLGRYPGRLSENSDADAVAQISELFDNTDQVLPWTLKAVHDHVVATNDLPRSLSARELEAAADTWELEPTLPSDLALRIERETPEQQLRSLIAWQNALKENNVDWQSLKAWKNAEPPDAVRQSFEKWDAQLSDKEPSAITKMATGTRLLPLAIKCIHGKALNDIVQDEFARGVVGTNDPYHAVNQIKSQIFSDTNSHIQATGKNYVTWAPGAAAGLAQIFGPRWEKWLELQDSLGRDVHDASVWLTAGSHGDLRALRTFLFDNAKEETAHLQTVANRWAKLDKNERTGSFASILERAAAMKYDDVTDEAFATEASQWGVSAESYKDLEQRYIKSLDVPTPFPLSSSWSDGNLVGRFIPRDDPRGLFLGNHTNSCQHPGGAADSAAWFGQTHPQSGFFVVEDATGKIVTESWVWIADNGGLVFDNIEGKGILDTGSDRRAAIKSIYAHAAKDLSAEYPIVTVGTGYDKLGLTDFPAAGNKKLEYRHDYVGYDHDAREQRILAESMG